MQRRKQVPWAGIIFLVIALNIFTDLDLPVVPLIIGAVVISMFMGPRGKRSVSRPDAGQRRPPPVPDHRGPEDSSGLPRIDVPRYPDQPPPPPLPTVSSTTAPGPGAPASGPTSPPGGTAYPGSTSTDPVVSLGQLHLARLGRELDAAARGGHDADVARLLTEVDDVVERSSTMLSGAEGSPGSGRRDFESGLRRLQREVSAARGEQPAGSRVHRVVQTCTSMGQTGRYE